MTKISHARDLAVIAGAITTGLAATYLMLDDLLASPPWKTRSSRLLQQRRSCQSSLRGNRSAP